MTKPIFCSRCINPDGYGILNPSTGKEIFFHQTNSGLLCDACFELSNLRVPYSQADFAREFDGFLDRNKQILFAFSGGLDSTVVLSLLMEKCREYDRELVAFTVQNGVKGRIAEQNIANIIKHLGLKRHFWADIRQKVQTSPRITEVTGQSLTTIEVFRYCRQNNILPCGKICNAMMDSEYSVIMNELGFSELVTGGDTPKKNENGRYSIMWKKASGISIVRGGCALGLNKKNNARFVRDKCLPWVHPHCGGYDTDCLIPGVFFAEATDGAAKIPLSETIRRFPIILEYLSERVRFGIIKRPEAIRLLTRIDITSLPNYMELERILRVARPE